MHGLQIARGAQGQPGLAGWFVICSAHLAGIHCCNNTVVTSGACWLLHTCIACTSCVTALPCCKRSVTFRQLLAAADHDVVYGALKWVLSQGQVLEKRAFVGYYLSFPDVRVTDYALSSSSSSSTSCFATVLLNHVKMLEANCSAAYAWTQHSSMLRLGCAVVTAAADALVFSFPPSTLPPAAARSLSLACMTRESATHLITVLPRRCLRSCHTILR